MKHYAPLLCVSQFFGTTQKTHKTQCEKRVVPSKVTNVRDEITCPDCLAEIEQSEKVINEVIAADPSYYQHVKDNKFYRIQVPS
jgi:hypothetical protein